MIPKINIFYKKQKNLEVLVFFIFAKNFSLKSFLQKLAKFLHLCTLLKVAIGIIFRNNNIKLGKINKVKLLQPESNIKLRHFHFN